MSLVESTSAVDEFVRQMPKAELHVHLEGSIEPETVLTLAKRHQMLDSLPTNTLEGLRKWFTFTDFPHFVEIYMTLCGLLRTPDDFATIVYASGRDMAEQNIRYRELTVTPYTHTNLQDKGLKIDDILAGLVDGKRKAKADFGVEMNWVFDIPRNAGFAGPGTRYNPAAADTTLDFALAGLDMGVVGFGLGGFEQGAPPEPFAHAFSAARRNGLRSVPHAGETVGPDSVWGAIHNLEADRIGHGVRSIEDPDLLAYLKAHQIVLEVNLTSNVCLHIYRRLAEHPFPHLDKMGLLLTLNSDDPPLFNTTLCDEYLALATEFGYDRQNLVRVARNAFVASYIAPEIKQRMLAEFDLWCENANVMQVDD